MLPILNEYLGYYNQFYNKYKDKTVILMQVGSFYEIYGIDNEYEKRGNAVEIANILNIVLTRKNKNIPDNNANNPLMTGFPCLALDKFIPILLENNYTITVVDQIKSGLNITRKISNIISPATYLETTEDSYLTLLYIDKVDKNYHIGISAINVITGKSIVNECLSSNKDSNVSLDDTISFMKQYITREIIIVGYMSNDIISYLELESSDILCHKKELNKNMLNVHYQNAIIGDVFKNETIMSNIEFINLEHKMYALTSFVMLLEFLHSHNPILLRKLHHPEIYIYNTHLTLETNTVNQLNIISNVRNKSLFSVLNKCSTALGKRLFKSRLLSPIYDTNKLNSMYQQIIDFKMVDIATIEKILNLICDIERLHRRLLMKILTYNELYMLITSYKEIIKLYNILSVYTNSLRDILLTFDEYKQILKFVDICEKTFVIDNLPLLSKEINKYYRIFNNEVFKNYDILQENIDIEIQNIKDIMVSIGIDGAYIDYAHNMGFYISVNTSKMKHVNLTNNNLIIKQTKTITRITSREINNSNNKINLHLESSKSITKKCYNAILEYFATTYDKYFDKFTNFVAKVDVLKSNYKVSQLYNYCKPTIVSAEQSFVKAKHLRHPIIERLDNGMEYIPNDISIGSEYNGIILYSMNSCGKTSLLKACGLSVILAQIGSFVPATEFVFNPFKRIMTRILSEDNMVKGHSSFVAEMLELRSILKRAVDSSTLVLADEITHGTEHTSGSAIFISCVEMLAKRNVNFMFTTHLHNVYSYIKDISNVKIFHLSIYIDKDQIVFERKLKPGPGNSVYGLEVCDFLNMDKEFISRAFKIRNQITPDKTEMGKVLKMSSYNKSLPVKYCQICKYSPKVETDIPLDIHHIKFQSSSDPNDMINGIHKDSKSNIAVLCKQCHQKLHKGKINISGYIQTTKGIKLCVTDF